MKEETMKRGLGGELGLVAHLGELVTQGIHQAIHSLGFAHHQGHRTTKGAQGVGRCLTRALVAIVPQQVHDGAEHVREVLGTSNNSSRTTTAVAANPNTVHSGVPKQPQNRMAHSNVYWIGPQNTKDHSVHRGRHCIIQRNR